MSGPASAHGQQLWRLLPEVHRTRDNGDLARYLDACGALLDRIRETLDQRLADAFPDPPDEGEGQPAQPWLLPYFARLLDARLLSPHVEGRREEVARAISWRQRGGTLKAIEEIAEAITGRRVRGVRGREVEIQEGFRRVVTTARIGAPILPPIAFGVRDPDLAAADPSPSVAARHPGLPAGTVDLRRVSRAVRTSADHPLAHVSGFRGPGVVAWRQAAPRGAPCFPGSYEDVSVRTVDVRAPGRAEGHAHPKRALLFASPPMGMFRPGHSSRRGAPDDAQPEDEVVLDTDAEHVLVDRAIATLRLEAGTLQTHTCTIGHLVVTAPEPPGDDDVVRLNTTVVHGAEVGARARLERCTLDGPATFTRLSASRCLGLEGTTVTVRGPAQLDRCALPALVVERPGDPPRLGARGTLLGTLEVGGRAELEYCTVLGRTSVRGLDASDCVLAGEVVDEPPRGSRSCVRFSRVADPPGAPAELQRYATTSAIPVFADFELCDEPPAAGAFDCPGRGVLDPVTSDAIRFGAEDGGEMGVYHDDAHSLEERALLDKVAGQLPFGLVPVLVPDVRLLQRPPHPRGSDEDADLER